MCHSTAVAAREQRPGVLLHHVGPRNRIQVVRLGSKCPYPQSCVAQAVLELAM